MKKPNRQEMSIMKRDRTKGEKWLFALSILLHIAAIVAVIISLFLPILKPVFNIMLEAFGKLIVFGILLFLWFAVGVFSLGFLFTVEKFVTFPSLAFKEIFQTETEFVVVFDYNLMIICGVASLIATIISLVILSKQKDTFKPKNYKNKKWRRIFQIIISILLIAIAVLFKFEVL